MINYLNGIIYYTLLSSSRSYIIRVEQLSKYILNITNWILFSFVIQRMDNHRVLQIAIVPIAMAMLLTGLTDNKQIWNELNLSVKEINPDKTNKYW